MAVFNFCFTEKLFQKKMLIIGRLTFLCEVCTISRSNVVGLTSDENLATTFPTSGELVQMYLRRIIQHIGKAHSEIYFGSNTW
jgi:hypothetical protein